MKIPQMKMKKVMAPWLSFLMGSIVGSIVVSSVVSSVFAQSVTPVQTPTTLPSQSANFPSRTVKIVGPGAGSGTDITARILAKSLSKIWSQSVIIENKPGAGGTLGISAVVNAPPDGYTLLAQSATYVINPAVYKNIPYDVNQSLVDLDMITTSPYVLVTAANSSIKSLDDLVRQAKQKSGELTFSSAGIGSSTHLAAEYLNQVAGMKSLHIPFKSTPEAMQDVISSRVTYVMAPIEAAIPQILGGKLRALGVSSKTRVDSLPQVPTIAEQLKTNFELNFWVGLWAPKATPKETVQKLKEGLNKALTDPQTQQDFMQAGMTVKSMGDVAFAKFVRDEMAKYRTIVQDAGISPLN